jgi:hypothetical protein
MRRVHRLLAGLLTAGALLTATAGCAQSVEPIERLGRKAAQKVTRPRPAPAVGPQAYQRGDHGKHCHHAEGRCGSAFDGRYGGSIINPRSYGTARPVSSLSLCCPDPCAVRAVACGRRPVAPCASGAGMTPRLVELALRLTEC